MEQKNLCFSIVFFLGVNLFAQYQISCQSGCEKKTQEQRYMQFAESFFRKKNIYQAAKYYQQVLDYNSNNMKAKYGFGLCYFYMGEHDKVYGIFKKLTRLFPEQHMFHFVFAKTCKELGKIDEARVHYQEVIVLNPEYKKAYDNLGFIYFQLGDYEKGHKTHNSVSKVQEQGQKAFAQEPKFYNGHQDIRGKVVLVRDEGGFGDLFQWVRFVKQLKQKGAFVVFEARRRIIPLLSNCPYIDKLIPQKTNFTNFDYQIYSGGIWRVHNTTVETIPNDVPYLYPDEMLVKKWEKVFSQDKNFKIGICWDPSKCGNPVTGKEFINPRAISLSYFYELSKLKGVSLYCLQQRNGLEQLDTMPKDFEIYRFNNSFDKIHGGFSDTAAVMKNLDLVITADTSIAHLAGALGVKVWVALPIGADWRWMLDRSDSPWYPTMKLFRQESFKNWDPVFRDIISDLQQLLQHKDKTRDNNFKSYFKSLF